MSSHTDLVTRIGEAGAIPANRGIDIARRVLTAMAIGSIFGSLFGIVVYLVELSIIDLAVMLLPLAVYAIILYFVWQVVQPKTNGDPVPVVARTLATSESSYLRYVRSGGNRGLLVPVVAMPVDGNDSFRSVILIRELNQRTEVEDPPAGTLLPLLQVEPGMGELTNIDEVTPEQEALLEKLTKRPRTLSNNAKSLPMRRGPLERKPRSSAIQWWVGLAFGGLLAYALTVILAMNP